jgi:hypothetical protein
MGKEKKVTVKPFLNKKLKSKQFALGEGELYPLYFQVIYDQKTTRFQAGNNWFAVDQEDQLKNNPVVAGTISAIKKIIRHEAERVEGFVIKGIGDRIKSYSTDMGTACKISLSQQIGNTLKSSVTVVDFEVWNTKNVSDKIEDGIIKLGSSASEELARLYLLSALVDIFAPDGLTVFSWLISEERNEVVTRIEQKIKEQQGRNLTIVTGRGDRLSYTYPLRVGPTIEGFDKVAHQIIDSSIHFIPSFKSVSYDSVDEIFRFKLGKK